MTRPIKNYSNWPHLHAWILSIYWSKNLCYQSSIHLIWLIIHKRNFMPNWNPWHFSKQKCRICCFEKPNHAFSRILTSLIAWITQNCLSFCVLSSRVILRHVSYFYWWSCLLKLRYLDYENAKAKSCQNFCLPNLKMIYLALIVWEPYFLKIGFGY